MHTQTAETLREVYPRFDDFVRVRDELDPEGRFANPYLDRVLRGVRADASTTGSAGAA
jgi:L-gulono-1,4-lactone dehydrogenase